MNRWKLAFFTLVALLIVIGAFIYVRIFGVTASDPIVEAPPVEEGYRTLQVWSSKEDFEAIANTYMNDAMPKEAEDINVQLHVEEDIALAADIQFFSSQIPVKMHFEPTVTEGGNLLLNQSKLEIGRLNISPRAVLKVIRDADVLPRWMDVRPKEQQIFIDLSSIPFANGIQVRVATIDLANDHIELHVDVPTIE